MTNETFQEKYPKGSYPDELEEALQTAWYSGQESFKQKVRDAINKIRINWVNDSYDFEAKLRKEIGLEDE